MSFAALPKETCRASNSSSRVHLGEGPGTWWGLIIDGLEAAGLDDEDDQVAYLNQVFGTNFDNLDDLKAFNLALVEDGWDDNGNGYVRAFELRGTRAYYGNPLLNLTFFGISDDQIKKTPR